MCDMLEIEALPSATKAKNQRIFNLVKQMRVRQKRQLFYVLRHVPEVSSDTFLPQYGLHCGEFACFQILSEYSRKENKRDGDGAAREATAPPVPACAS